MKDDRIRIYSYNKVWKMENKIYAIQNIVLPVPIKPHELMYFLSVAGIVFVLCQIFTFVGYIPVVIRYIAIPYGVTQFLLKKKLDGKTPQKYLLGYIKYLVSKNEYIERFQSCANKKEERIRLRWMCSTRN